jgi:hypothetical protein
MSSRLIRRQTGGDERRVQSTDGGRNQEVGVDPLLEERAQHPDLHCPEACASRENECGARAPVTATARAEGVQRCDLCAGTHGDSACCAELLTGLVTPPSGPTSRSICRVRQAYASAAAPSSASAAAYRAYASDASRPRVIPQDRYAARTLAQARRQSTYAAISSSTRCFRLSVLTHRSMRSDWAFFSRTGAKTGCEIFPARAQLVVGPRASLLLLPGVRAELSATSAVVVGAVEHRAVGSDSRAAGPGQQLLVFRPV